MSSEQKRIPLLKRKSTWDWVRAAIEVVSLLVLVFHLIPHDLNAKLKENGFGLFILVVVALIIAILANWTNTNGFLLKSKQKDEEIKELNQCLLQIQNDNAVRINELDRLGRYSSTFSLLNKAFAELRQAERYELKSKNQQKFESAFKDFCNSLNEVFTKVTGTSCHVCIKVVTSQGKKHKPKVKTLVRDGFGNGFRNHIDSERIEHFLHENTDFNYVFEHMNSKEGRFFFSGDLTKLNGYKNSSFKIHNEDKSPTYKYEMASQEQREAKWCLPYKSVICAAICPGIADIKASEMLIGFLCIDAQDAKVFKKEIDPEIISGCADGVYDSLKNYIETYLITPRKT